MSIRMNSYVPPHLAPEWGDLLSPLHKVTSNLGGPPCVQS